MSSRAGFGWSCRALPESGAKQDLLRSEVRSEIAERDSFFMLLEKRGSSSFCVSFGLAEMLRPT